MEYILIFLLFILGICLYRFIINSKYYKSKDNKKQTYILLLILISIFIICEIFNKSNKKKESFYQSGGSNKIEKLRNLCGFSKYDPETKHCFSDSTHHTCCMLGKEARKYADQSKAKG